MNQALKKPKPSAVRQVNSRSGTPPRRRHLQRRLCCCRNRRNRFPKMPFASCGCRPAGACGWRVPAPRTMGQPAVQQLRSGGKRGSH
jgi:hypothetical protein